MFLHLGRDVIVSAKNIIAILDLDTTTISKITQEFLAVSQEEGFVENVSDDLPKSFVITESDNKIKIYLSNISSVTLQKRMEYINSISL